MATLGLTVSDISRYPIPSTLPSAVASPRKDGERLRGGWDLDKLELEGNEGGKIPNEQLTWLKPIPATAPIEEIRAAYNRDGVVHIRGLLDRERVLDTRRKFFEYVRPAGVLREGVPEVEGIYNSDIDPARFPGPSATQFASSESDNKLLDLSTKAGREQFIIDFSDDPALLSFVGRLMQEWEQPFRFKRQLLRTNIPKAYKAATRVHYDQMYLRGMAPGALTGWIPMGDVSPLSGGLMYLENSVPLGMDIETRWSEINASLPAEERLSAFNQNMLYGGGLTKDCKSFSDATNRRWMVGDYRAGDVVFHHCCMIHCSANNEDPEDRIRLATDVRFADKAKPYDTRWEEYYYPGDKK